METSQMQLGGLPYNTSSTDYFQLLVYLLLLLLGDCASGIPAAQQLLKQHNFVLLRAGWQRWFWLTLRRCFLVVLTVCAALLLIGLLFFPEWETLWAGLMFTLHMEMVAAVQVLLMALVENAAAMLPVFFVQLASLLLSSRLPGAWALLLPGNWGALARTAEFEVPDSLGNVHGGFPLWAAVALNAAVLLAIGSFGWRPIRRKHLKQ